MDRRQSNEFFYGNQNRTYERSFSNEYKSKEQNEIEPSGFLFRLIGIICFVLIMAMIVADIQKRISYELNGQILKKQLCRKEYDQNKCLDPVPEIEKFCLQKESCFKENPKYAVYTFKALFWLLTDTFNGIIALLQWKSLSVLGFLIVCWVMARVVHSAKK